MFVTPKNTFINVLNKGLYRLESDTLFPIVTGYLTENVDILFALPYNNRMVLVGLSDGRLSLFDGIKYYDYNIKDDGYLRENIISEGIAVGDSLYAITTIDGGALVIDKLSGKIRFTINYQNELPDDEIFAVGLDKSGGLWLPTSMDLPGPTLACLSEISASTPDLREILQPLCGIKMNCLLLPVKAFFI